MRKKQIQKKIWSVVFLSAMFFMVGLVSPLLAAKTEELTPPLGSASTNPDILVTKIINIALGLLSVATLAIFIYGGFLIMFSGGAPELLKKGKNVLVWAVIGLAIIMSSYGLVKYVFEVLGS